MARSITFIVDSDVDTQITITENDYGTLTFDIEVLGSGLIGDLRAIFFDLQGLEATDALSVVTDSGAVTDEAYDEGSVDTLGKDANIKGSVSNELGDFDVGIEFGTSGMAADDIQSASFTLALDGGALTLDMLNLADFGLRYTSVGEADGDRTGSAKIGGESNGVAGNDAFTVVENESGAIDLLANDGNGGTNTVAGVTDAAGAFTATAGGFERLVVAGGLVLGTLTVTIAGVATFAATGADVDTLAAGEMHDLAFSYTTVAADGSLATADAVLTIQGTNDAPAVSGPISTTAGEADAAFSVDLLANASDIDLGDVLAIANLVLVSGDASGVTVGATALSVDPSAYEALGNGESAVIVYGYDVIDGNGGITATTVTITITGEGAPLFTTGDDVVDFATVLAGDYDPGTQYAALDGHDVVILPGTLATAAAAGFVAGTAFDGGAGDDEIRGGALDDVILGSAGDDLIVLGSGADRADGGADDDRIEIDGLDAADAVDGGAGNDTLALALADGMTHELRFMDGLDYLVDGVVVDVVNVENFEVDGSDSRDVVNFWDGDDVFWGHGGNDNVNARNGHNTLYGGDGNDTLWVGNDSSHIDGGAGFDQAIFFSTTEDFVVDVGAGTATASNGQVTTFVDAEWFTTWYGDDTMIGDAGNNQFGVGAGTNTVFGGDGDDFLTSDYGATNSYDGGAGYDVLALGAVNGSYTDFTTGIAEIFGSGVSSFTYFTNVEQLRTHNGPDTVIGDDNGQFLLVGGGDSWISAAGGDDGFELHVGNHTVDGGTGFDTAFFNVTTALTVDLAAGTATGASGNSTLVYVESVLSGGADDLLYGDGEANALASGFGDDLIDGRGGNDTLSGGAGNDTIIGGTGDDELFGNQGDDLFIFAAGDGADRIVGFAAGAGSEDVMDISAFLFADFAAVLAAASNEVGGVVIDLDGVSGGDQVQLHGLLAAQLDADDFILL